MANFSTNQVKQFYVAKALDANLDTKGDVAFVKCGNDVLMKHVGEGGLTATDRMPIASLKGVAVKSSASTMTLNSAHVAPTAANIVAGQAYILKIKVRQFVGISDANTYDVFADYTPQSGDGVKEVVAHLASVLAKSLNKLASPLFKVYVTTTTTAASVAAANSRLVNAGDSVATISAQISGSDIAALYIQAAEQPYRKGIIESDNVSFTVACDKIIKAGNPTDWATVTYNAASIAAVIPNSKKIADLEYFCMGERGDIYRGVGFPNNIETKYMVDPEATYGYHLIELTFAYQGDAEDVQKSPKEIIIAVPAEGYTTYTAINAILGASTSAANSLSAAVGSVLIPQLS